VTAHFPYAKWGTAVNDQHFVVTMTLLERSRQRLRHLRINRESRKSKKRTASLDETVKTLRSLRSEAPDDCLEENAYSQPQGAASKATTILFRRRASTAKICDEKDVDESPMCTLHEESLLDSEVASRTNDAVSMASPPNKSQDPAVLARKEAIKAQQKLLGKDHPDVLFSLECLMRFHRARGEHQEALATFEEKQQLSRESYWNRMPRPTNAVIAHE
jgi:hypothetical protein